MKAFVSILIVSMSVIIANAQALNDNRPPDYSGFGIELINPNYNGVIGSTDMEINPELFALLNYESKFSYGLHYMRQRQFLSSNKFSFLLSLGLNVFNGELSYRSRGGSHGGNKVGEAIRTTEFSRYFLNTSYRIKYLISKKSGLGLIIGPKLAAKVKSTNSTNGRSFVKDYTQNPVFIEVRNTYNNDRGGEDFVDLQFFLNAGLHKSFNVSDNQLSVGIEYNHSLLLSFHNAGKLKSNFVSLVMNYYIQSKESNKDKI